ncbi:hypothetical protein XH94_15700 [Bradyrhizobium zhanjiangense]|uniref:Uncharacterized protein n=1 Tax=Bradyrhizobium zhanjiangense TaxID=1325107 RepID=A0A4Q0SKS7_9BRAD|nr:hypothetical protein XH94_15700 [Bradyrhizobium zhanjiangense]
MDVPVEDVRERPDDVADGIDAPDDGIGGSRDLLGANEETHGDPRHVFSRDQRQNGALVT